MINITDNLTFKCPISPLARRQSEQFCTQQATPQKCFQVRLNTLAVSFVNSYLQCMGFETDLAVSDSWNPLQQTLLDVADLELKNLGKLECRPVLEGTQVVYVPPEVESNRIGYLVVQISKSLREATLLGFIQKVTTDSLSLSQLESLERFHEYLEDISQVKPVELASLSFSPGKTLVNLKQWFENSFEAGWQSIEGFLATQPGNVALSFRSAPGAGVERGKLIDLGIEVAGQSVVLVVALTPENEQKLDIQVEVHPANEQTYLPPYLQLMILDEEGIVVMEAQARSINSNIQVQFSGKVGERFSVKVVLGHVTVIENFVI